MIVNFIIKVVVIFDTIVVLELSTVNVPNNLATQLCELLDRLHNLKAFILLRLNLLNRLLLLNLFTAILNFLNLILRRAFISQGVHEISRGKSLQTLLVRHDKVGHLSVILRCFVAATRLVQQTAQLYIGFAIAICCLLIINVLRRILVAHFKCKIAKYKVKSITNKGIRLWS